MILKDDIRNAVKTIRRMVKFSDGVEKFFGKSYENTELDWILSEMVKNLCALVSLTERQTYDVSDILFNTEASESDVLKAIDILCNDLGE